MRIHFIGIGGIGMSALARYFLAQGNEVSGSDAAESAILEDLRKAGVKIISNHPNPLLEGGQNAKSPLTPLLQSGETDGSFTKEGTDLVIYSAAVREDNPELVEARKLGIKCQKYAEALGELTREKYTIAVSGMHGKSTTTAMIGLMMEKAGLDPTVIVGTRLREWGNSNFRAGQSPSTALGVNNYLVIEADEYDRSFLNYWPKILVLLNIEEEHLDTYTGGLPDIMKTFEEYVGHVGSDGMLIYNDEDKNVLEISQKSKAKSQKYSSNIVEGLNLKVSGRHNISNANAALAVARVLGIDEKIAIEALNNFTGAWRRMEYKGELNGAKIYDDYGHHPTEIKATLEGARELVSGGGRLWCVFQPHQYHRTYDLFDKFVGAFGAADRVVLLPIYSVAGREDEEIKKMVSSRLLMQAINNKQSTISNKEEVFYMEKFDEAAEYLRKNMQPGDVCVIMGAGDIYKLTGYLIK